MSLYICLGTPPGPFEDLEDLSATGKPIGWTINAKAKIGDAVFFYLVAPFSSIIARGRVQSPPGRNPDRKSVWFRRFMADIGDISMLPRPLHIRELRTAFPDWGYLKSPIQSSRVPDEIVPQLLQMAGTPNVIADIQSIYTDPRRSPTEKEALGTARIGQGQFRRDLQRLWKACAVTGCRELSLLRASHIKPWSASTDAERLDPYNGLLLVPNLDVAFDSGYISFLDNGKILISSRLHQTARKIMGIHRETHAARREGDLLCRSSERRRERHPFRQGARSLGDRQRDAIEDGLPQPQNPRRGWRLGCKRRGRDRRARHPGSDLGRQHRCRRPAAG